MSKPVTVRPLRPQDLAAVVAIDAKVAGRSRARYYEEHHALGAGSGAQINASLVAEVDGVVVGFLMGTLSFGDFCIPDTAAVVDTLGVDPDCQDRGVGGALFEQFRANMRAAGVERIYTLVDWADFGLLKFFGKMGFGPSQRLSLECPVR